MCVCVCMGHHAHCSHFSVVGEANCKNKARSYLGFDMSRITCSIECAAYYLLITLCSLLSFLSLLNGFLSLSVPPLTHTHMQAAPRSLPVPLPVLYLLTLTKLKRFSLGWARATWKLQRSLASRQWPAVALCSPLPSQLIPGIGDCCRPCLRPTPSAAFPGSPGPIVPGRLLFNAVLQVIKPWKSINHSSGAVEAHTASAGGGAADRHARWPEKA